MKHAAAEEGEEIHSSSEEARMSRAADICAAILLLVIPGSFIAMFALEDVPSTHQCTSMGGHAQRVGGPSNDLFLACLNDQGRIIKVYGSEGGRDEEKSKCKAQGGHLYTESPSKIPWMMCVVDGKVAWTTGP